MLSNLESGGSPGAFVQIDDGVHFLSGAHKSTLVSGSVSNTNLSSTFRTITTLSTLHLTYPGQSSTTTPHKMPAASKTSVVSKEKDRRKSAGKPSAVVILRVPSDRLRKILDPSWTKEDSPAKESPAPLPVPANETPVAVVSQDENASPSSPGTPAASATPSQTPMGPPTDNLKKKGVKRSAAAANGNDPTAKIRGKPGPKKKARL